MSLSNAEQRALDEIEASLTEDDARLALLLTGGAQAASAPGLAWWSRRPLWTVLAVIAFAAMLVTGLLLGMHGEAGALALSGGFGLCVMIEAAAVSYSRRVPSSRPGAGSGRG